MSNVTLWGASYTDVAAVTLPQTGGGTASFTDVSDTTAAAGDVASGKYFYTAAGVKTEGTASGGGTEVESKDVDFYDYDGTRVASYTAQEFAVLTELPTNPSHTGLTAQGWNWSLADAKTYVASHGILDIGQMYVTSDGTTQIDIEVQSPNLSPYLSLTVNGTLSVDWGDNSASDTITGTNVNTRFYEQHTYPSSGVYTIKVTIVSGTLGFYSYQTAASSILSDGSGNEYSQKYANCVKAVRIGTNVNTSLQRAFQNCYGLEYVTIPSSATSYNHNAFNGCESLRHVTIPSGTTTIQGYMFTKCYSLTSVSLPKSVTTIKGYAFENDFRLLRVAASDSATTYETNVFRFCTSAKRIVISDGCTSIPNNLIQECNSLESFAIPSRLTSIGNNSFNACRSLTELTIPATVTTISNDAFAGCYSIQAYHFKPTSPPSIGNVNVFFGIPTNCVIYVPYSEDHSILEAYKTASNWSSHASKIQEEPQ